MPIRHDLANQPHILATSTPSVSLCSLVDPGRHCAMLLISQPPFWACITTSLAPLAALTPCRLHRAAGNDAAKSVRYFEARIYSIEICPHDEMSCQAVQRAGARYKVNGAITAMLFPGPCSAAMMSLALLYRPFSKIRHWYVSDS